MKGRARKWKRMKTARKAKTKMKKWLRPTKKVMRKRKKMMRRRKRKRKRSRALFMTNIQDRIGVVFRSIFFVLILGARRIHGGIHHGGFYIIAITKFLHQCKQKPVNTIYFIITFVDVYMFQSVSACLCIGM
jgi:hypothetical protein